MLIKKDFIKVAEILRSVKQSNQDVLKYERETPNAENTLYLIMDRLSDWFKSENPNFNEDKFRKAVLKE